MKKKDWLVTLLILGALAAVFWDLVTLERAFLSGDHREQQYPWAVFLQEAVRQFSVPWWTTRIQCGFPIAAEGQIGAFYPPNWLFFFFLPARAAYNWGILFHYALGALFFYAYVRRAGASAAAGFFGTLIFLFGSTQGGYFYYNYISQKVTVWLPLALILVDRLCERKKITDAFWLGAVFALQVFGGYLQVAVYSVFFTTVYFLWRWLSGERLSRSPLLYAAAGLLGIVFSLVQLWPTLELAALSSRSGADKAIAYLGSMTPLGFLTLFYPAWDGVLGSELYVGGLGLFFALLAAVMKKGTREKFFLFSFVLFFVLALGRFSPLYAGLVELTGFGGFRTPIKFLFFASFSLAVLAVFGFDAFFFRSGIADEARRAGLARRMYLAAAAAMLAVPPAAEFFLRRFSGRGLELLRAYVRDHVFGKPGHPYGYEFYMDKAAAFYDSVVRTVSFSFKDTRTEWTVLAAVLALVIFCLRPGTRARAAKVCVVALLAADLYLYGFTSLRPNWERWDSLDPRPGAAAEALDAIRRDGGVFRSAEIYTAPDQNRLFPVFPCFNMLYGVDDIGIYSPLAMRRYKEYVSGLAYVNDSLAVGWVDPQTVIRRLDKLSRLNVKYILSARPVEHPDLEALVSGDEVYLYRNRGVLPRAFFVPGAGPPGSLEGLSPDKVEPVTITEYAQTRVRLDCNTAKPGTLVMTDTFFPGWRARVDGRQTRIEPVDGLFRGLSLEPGRHAVDFEYRPDRYRIAGAAGAGLFMLMAFFTGAGFVKRRFLNPESCL